MESKGDSGGVDGGVEEGVDGGMVGFTVFFLFIRKKTAPPSNNIPKTNKTKFIKFKI